MSTHNATIGWLRPAETTDAEFLAGRYSRAHTIGFDGGVSVPGSSSPSVVRLPWSVEAAADPEELLVASTATCHMLWFLDYAKHAGFAVSAYRDEPEGVMGRFEGGATGIVKVILRPVVDFGGAAPDAVALETLHHKAHATCFIANSLRGEVVVESPSPASDSAAL